MHSIRYQLKYPVEPLPELLVPSDYSHQPLFFQTPGEAVFQLPSSSAKRRKNSVRSKSDNVCGDSGVPSQHIERSEDSLHSSLLGSPTRRVGTREGYSPSQENRLVQKHVDADHHTAAVSTRASTLRQQFTLQKELERLEAALREGQEKAVQREQFVAPETDINEAMLRPTRSATLRENHTARRLVEFEEASHSDVFVHKGKDTSSLLSSTSELPVGRLTRSARLLREQTERRLRDMEAEQQRKAQEEESFTKPKPARRTRSSKKEKPQPVAGSNPRQLKAERHVEHAAVGNPLCDRAELPSNTVQVSPSHDSHTRELPSLEETAPAMAFDSDGHPEEEYVPDTSTTRSSSIVFSVETPQGATTKSNEFHRLHDTTDESHSNIDMSMESQPWGPMPGGPAHHRVVEMTPVAGKGLSPTHTAVHRSRTSERDVSMESSTVSYEVSSSTHATPVNELRNASQAEVLRRLQQGVAATPHKAFSFFSEAPLSAMQRKSLKVSRPISPCEVIASKGSPHSSTIVSTPLSALLGGSDRAEAFRMLRHDVSSTLLHRFFAKWMHFAQDISHESFCSSVESVEEYTFTALSEHVQQERGVRHRPMGQDTSPLSPAERPRLQESRQTSVASMEQHSHLNDTASVSSQQNSVVSNSREATRTPFLNIQQVPAGDFEVSVHLCSPLPPEKAPMQSLREMRKQSKESSLPPSELQSSAKKSSPVVASITASSLVISERTPQGSPSFAPLRGSSTMGGGAPDAHAPTPPRAEANTESVCNVAVVTLRTEESQGTGRNSEVVPLPAAAPTTSIFSADSSSFDQTPSKEESAACRGDLKEEEEERSPASPPQLPKIMDPSTTQAPASRRDSSGWGEGSPLLRPNTPVPSPDDGEAIATSHSESAYWSAGSPAEEKPLVSQTTPSLEVQPSPEVENLFGVKAADSSNPQTLVEVRYYHIDL